MENVRFYGYKHWTLEEMPRCFYVGKGVKGRAGSIHHNHKCRAITKRYGLRVEVCVGPVTNEKACSWEIENIALMNTFSTNHSHDDPTDIGCNFTKGGEGSAGYRWTSEQRLRQKTVQNTPETLERKRLAQLAVSEQKSVRLKATMALPEEHARKSAVTSARNRLLWQDPVYRQEMLDQLNGAVMKQARADRMKQPDIRAIRSATMKRLWADPEYQAKLHKPVRCGLCHERGHNRRTCLVLTDRVHDVERTEVEDC